MKKIFNLSLITLLAGFFAVSCDRNDEDEIQNVESIKIDSVKIAQQKWTSLRYKPSKHILLILTVALVSMIITTKKMTLIDMLLPTPTN